MKRVDVLLAMGSPPLQKVTEEVLLQEGLSVKAVNSGLDLVTAAFSMKPRCVFCDEFLLGLDGIKVARLLSTMYSKSEIPVIISVPDLNPRVKRRAMSVSAVDVVEYSTPFSEIISKIRTNLSSVLFSNIKTGPSISHERIKIMASDSLENSLELIETVVDVAFDLNGVTSISEACRKVMISILGALGFQRAWIGFLNSSGTTVEVLAYRGKGLTGKSIQLSGIVGHLPVDVAVASGNQVVSWKPEFIDNRETWVGSLVYVDTPIVVASDVYGIIRCDNGISKKQPSVDSMRILKMLAGELSSFIKSFTAESQLEGFKNSLGQMLKRVSSKAVLFSKNGTVETVYGVENPVPGFDKVTEGMSLKEILGPVHPASSKLIESAVLENRNMNLSVVPLKNSESFLGFSLMNKDPDHFLLMISDNSTLGSLQRKIKLLEYETDAIATLAADLTSLMDPGEICRILLRTLEGFYPKEAIAILAASKAPSSMMPEKIIVHAVSSTGYTDSQIFKGAIFQITQDSTEAGVISEAVRTGRTINIADVLQTTMFISVLPGIRSELAIPLLNRGRVVGVIDLESTSVDRFGKNDIRRLNNLVGFVAGVLETALQQTELIKLTRRDRLTGLYNMSFFEERYPEEFERAERYEYSFSVIMMDIDDFKHYNDSFGHPMGNVLLQKLTRAMNDALRDVDILIRYGGEEFVCILPLTDKKVAGGIAERIRLAVMEASKAIPNAAEQPRGFVSLSLGVATFPIDSREKDELLEIADQRMYRAKRAGKNRVCSD